MRILYFVHWELGEADGVTRKIIGQCDTWRKHGHEVLLCAVSSSTVASDTAIKRFVPKGALRDRFVRRRSVERHIQKVRPDLVYTRTGLFHRSLSVVGRSVPVIREINTDEPAERAQVLRSVPSPANLARLLEAAVLSPQVIKRSAGIVTVTYEIAARLPNSIDKRRVAVVPNGIDLGAHPERSRSSPTDEVRRSVFFLGSPGLSWHGVDILLRIAEKTPEFDYHLVGPQGKSKGNVRFYGRLTAEDYRPIMDSCDVCVGTLALFRNGMDEACPLKVREYLARGLPTVIGFHDTAFSRANGRKRAKEQHPWLLQLDGTKLAAGDAQQEEAFRGFVQASRGMIVDRKYLAVIDLGQTEEKRLRFFEERRRRFDRRAVSTSHGLR